MAPILFRKSVFQLVRNECFWLSETPHIAGSRSWGSVFARTATWVELIHRPSGKSLVFLNTHFDYQPGAIDASARLLRNWISREERNLPLVVTGDFNAGNDSDAYRQLTAGGPLVDAYRQAHRGGADESTYHGFGRAPESAPIDWILVSGHFKVVDAAVDRSREGKLFPSDHYPITAVLNWR
jgi:endonuclease/exonuclease/phosphatase family metal-dependent hydrolase